MKAFQGLLGEFQGAGARVVGVSADHAPANGVFQDACGTEFPLLGDWPRYRTIDAFGIRDERLPIAQRVTFIFDADGVCRYVLKDLDEVEYHASEALTAVNEMVGTSG